jgi:AcrR family transcriptional regulator
VRSSDPASPARRSAGSTPPPRRQSAGERRAAILEAAGAEFAHTGLHGTTTETIARRAGVSQPYLFRLFGTKKLLYLATVDRGFERVLSAFRAAALDSDNPFHDMGLAYVELLADRDQLLCQMQAYAACGDADVQALVRRRYGELYQWLRGVPGATDEVVRTFLSIGMLLNVAAAMDLAAIAGDQQWAADCLGPLVTGAKP